MSRPQLNIKFDGEGEAELLEAVKARAKDERQSLKEFVLQALKARLASTPPTPPLIKPQYYNPHSALQKVA